MKVIFFAGIVRLFYFNDYGALELFYKQKIITCERKSFLFIGCTELDWNIKDTNVLCVSVLFKDMGWYLGVIGNLHNDSCRICIPTGEFLNGTPIIVHKSYNCFWYT